MTPIMVKNIKGFTAPDRVGLLKENEDMGQGHPASFTRRIIDALNTHHFVLGGGHGRSYRTEGLLSLQFLAPQVDPATAIRTLRASSSYLFGSNRKCPLLSEGRSPPCISPNRIYCRLGIIFMRAGYCLKNRMVSAPDKELIRMVYNPGYLLTRLR
jgi:hypothetical protein